MVLPYRQQDLADALGLSLVHTNKTLAKLRARQMASRSDGVLTVPDLDARAAVAAMELEDLPARPLM
ncbi:helix-turn-helix domain-containing protein [Jannaschia seohaensis]|uniref:Crp-like helix-turn-helix domain-containing protein n=1 Tax=Jannaschia seohaensis TaxID=475081 RepID=A0A2Y9A825_9RHOB|nr:helix-turn-helix domain-containing protein [Jannaschia seohaensis]PWJ22059.1 Crp-like helix-turn-helix protein [Jannaschia seohaensis]SSA38337.1 Crp-like helix-turn-helix domain-containing protein [Jannaschia seohaensis]